MTNRHTAPLLLLVLLLFAVACAVADDRIPQATLLGVPVDIEEVTSNEGEGSVTMTELPSDPDDPATDRWTVYFLSDGLYYVDDAGTVVGPLIDATSVVTDHGALTGLADDDHPQYLLADGTRALTGAWDAGSFNVRAETFTSDVATGTAPLTVSSTTVVSNLNADLLDGEEGSHYLDSANFTGTDWTDLTDSGSTTLHTHDHGGLGGLTDDDHTQYALLAGRSTGQTLNGGTGASENLTLNATSNATLGNVIINGVVDLVDGMEVDTASYVEFTNGTHAVRANATGTELLLDSDGATMNSIGINDLDVVVKTGDVTVTAGDITATAGDIVATAGDVLVTAGGVGIGSGAPSAKLHVDDGGTTPAIASSTLAIFQDSNAGNSQAWISILGGNATSGQAGINFGHQTDENNAAFWSDFTPTTGGLRWRTNGSGVDMQMDYSGNLLLYNSFDVQGTATVGSSSNTRWDQSSILDGYAYSTGTTPTLTATNGSTYYTFPDQASAAYVVLPIKAVLGSKVKAVKAYYYGTFTSAASIIGVDIKAATNAGVLVSVGTRATASISSTGAGTVTQSLGTASSVAAGLPLYAVIDRTDNLGDATFLLTAVEIQYEEREY